jgi:hypothetical protein
MHLNTEELRSRFTFHPADTLRKQDRHALVRKACLIAAETLIEATGQMSREQSLAITKLEEAMFWANAAVAREEGSDPSDP